MTAPLLFVLGAAAGLAATLAAGGAFRRLDAVRVEGASMAPTLLPGELLLVESWTYARRSPRPGDLLVVGDPRLPAREILKRVVAVHDGGLEVRGDHASHSTDSRSFGWVPTRAARWRPVVRYWPPLRAGRVR